VRIDAPLLGSPLAAASALALSHEAAGFDGVFTFDGPYEPFASLALAAEHTRLDLATGVAIALARSPMTVAQSAHDLHIFSGGRLTLGLGSQIQAHIERRFSMPWSRPVSRMKEFVGALRAIFACWNDDVPLRFEGEFYRHTLMPPLMRPAPSPFGPPPILLAAVGRAMLEAAGEVADGCVLHPFHSRRYLDDFALPALARGRARSGRGDLAITAQVLVVTGADEREWSASREAVRAQVAFYASTPAYRAVLEAEGRGELQPELRRLTREGRWSEMAALVDDELLARVAVVGAPGEVGRELKRRYEGLAVRVAIATPMLLGDAASRDLLHGFREA
jgi:probable F420-dependent oxidoreductase